VISTEKPGTPQDLALEHHGVLGMRWGHRREGTAQIGRRAANRKAKESFIRKNPTSDRQAKAIRTARAKSQLDLTRYTNQPRGTSKAKKQSLKKVYLNNPDRATALRMTRGEKVVLGLIAVGLPGPGTVGVAVGATAQVAVRRHVERKQARGGY